jgi:ketosteroid isomerase-like protein
MSFTQSSQGTLATREASAEEQTFITDILKLYQLEPSEQSYRHYADNAVFHDPVSIAKGKESVMSQFNGMPKIFARSDTKGMSFTPLSITTNIPG